MQLNWDIERVGIMRELGKYMDVNWASSLERL